MTAPAPEMPAFLAKICTREQAVARIAALPRPLVFTNGVFDVLHTVATSPTWRRHAPKGASLVVALNTDASARRLGKAPEPAAEQPGRPRRHDGGLGLGGSGDLV